MNGRIYKPRRLPDGRPGWVEVAAFDWRGALWEVWAKAPRKRSKKPYPHIRLFAREGAEYKANFAFLWHPDASRFVHSLDYGLMLQYYPDALNALQASIAALSREGLIPGTERFNAQKV